MNLQSLQRSTLNFEGAPSPQLYKHTDGTLYWDLDYLHITLAAQGADKHKYHWLSQLKDTCNASPFLADAGGTVHIHTASRSAPTDLQANVCSTLALCSYLWVSINAVRLAPVVKCCCELLLNIADRACEALPAEGDRLHLRGHTIEIRRPGMVSGLWEFLETSHVTVAQSWAKTWDSLRLLGILETDKGRLSPMRDVLVFLVLHRKSRRDKQQPKPSPLASKILDELSFAFVKWLTWRMDVYVKDVYLPNHNTDQPPPALRKEKGTTYVRVSVDAVWQLMEKANATGISLAGAIALKSDEATLGCSPKQCNLWMNKYQQMYAERASMGFLNVSHFNIVADGSTHSCKDTLVSLAYTWEHDLAAYLPIQRIQPGSHVTMLDQEMPEEIAMLAAKRKLQRVSAFRQVQSLSHQISLLTQGRLNIDSFKLDGVGVHLQPVAPGEVRVVRPGDEGMTTDAAVIVKAGQTFEQVLPNDFTNSLLLVVNLDQGSIGEAGMAFAIHHKALMVWARFDKFHRIIRDVKLSLKHCCGGVFLKTQLFTSYLYGLNYKPFSSGGFSQVKARLLQVFLATEDIKSAIWLKYCDRIASDFGLPPPASDEDHEALRLAVACLPSYSRKGSLPKLGRWFSWNGCAHEQMPEFHASKMLFEHHLDSGELDPDLADAFDGLVAAGKAPTPAAQLAALKNVSGGLSLAYKLMSSSLHAHAKILYYVSKPCWDWYVTQVTEVKTPADGLRYSAQLAEGQWARELHLWQTLNTLYDESTLALMGFPQGGGASLDAKCAHKVLMLAWHVVSRRAWSLSRHDVPPECFAAAASSDQTISQRVVDSMKNSWKILTRLEQRVHDVPAAKQLWNDLDFAKSQPVRLLFCFFERDQWRCQSPAGRRWLSGLLCTFPDNKIVEDVHGAIRRESLGNANSKLTSARIQEVVVRSGVFESRKIPHPAAVTNSVFRHKFKLLKHKRIASTYNCAKHKLPPSWTGMWGKRTWKPLTEDGNHKSQAAWRWLHARGQLAVSLALWSRLVMPFMLVVRIADGKVYASFGNASWAVLGWPMTLVAGQDGSNLYVFQPRAAVEWFHVTAPMDWEVIPFAGERCAMGIVLRQIADRAPLMRYTVLQRSTDLSYQDLSDCATHLKLDVGKSLRLDLLKALGSHFGEASQEEQQKQTDAAASIAEDPLAEAVYGDMDKAEQMEFPEVDAAFKQKREQQRIAEWRALKAAAPVAKKRRLVAGPFSRRARKRRRPQPVPDVPMVEEVPQELPGVPPPQEPPGEPPEPEQELPAALVAPVVADLPPELPAALVVAPAVDVVEDLLPGAAAANAAGQSHAGARRGRAGPATPWEVVLCVACGSEAGQYKFEPCPGLRDGPSWIMRTANPDGAWPTCGPRFRTRRTSVVGDSPDFAQNWCQTNRTCCANGAPS